MNLEQIIKRQEEKLPKLIVDLVWSVTDGGCKLKENQLLSYQDEPVREYEDIINWHSSSIKEILEGVGKSCCNACDCCVQLKNATKELQK